MNRTSWFVVIALGAFGVTLVRADDTYTIKIKPASKGDVGQINKEEGQEQRIVITVGGNVVQDKKESTKEVAKYKEEVIEKEKGKRATNLKRTYEKAVVTENDKDKDMPYSGKTLLIKKDGDKFTFQIEKGDTLKEADVPNLVKEFKKEDDDEKIQELFLPKKPVAVNDTWNVDKDALKTMFGKGDEGMKFDVDNTKATGKLIKAYKNGDKQYGVIQYDIDLPLESVGGNTFEKGAKMALKMTIDVCIDGSEDAGTVKGEFTMSGKFTTKDGATVAMDIKGKSTEKREEGKK